MRAWPPPTTIGTVTDLPYWMSELRAGRCFFRQLKVANLAANFSMFQLKNPAASGVVVEVFSLSVVLTGAAEYVISRNDTDLTTDVGTGFNLLTGGAASLAHVRSDQVAAIPGTSYGTADKIPSMPAEEQLPGWFMSLSAGQGVQVSHNVLNTSIYGAFFWREG